MTDIQIIYDGPIVKRTDAIQAGEKFYFTGLPCKNNHIDQRQCSNWSCRECIRLTNKRWRRSNPDEVRRLDRDWWRNNRERKLALCKKWRASNPEKIKEYSSNARARRVNAEGKFTNCDINNILKRQFWKCAEVSCGIDLSSGYHVDHIIPLILGGTNWPSNLQCLCPRCNLSKGGKHPIDWAREKGRLL